MARFRKKPVVVEAEQWFPDKSIEGVVTDDRVPISINALASYHYPVGGMGLPQYGAVETLEGWLIVTPGDWIITGVQGEKYPCKPEIFKATYEPVDDEMPEVPHG